MRTLSDSELVAAREALTGPGGDELLSAMFALALGQPAESSMASKLGWVNGGLTELGRLVADPLREFGFWLERDRRLPSEELVPGLRRERYLGKRVLEVGSGGGCNLLSLSGIPARLVGVEPMPVYRQMMPILAELAGLPAPEAVDGTGRSLPFADASFDIALCYSSHQYMEVDDAVREMRRVLAPGGELIIVGNTLLPFGAESVGRFVRGRSLGTLKYDLTAVVNTLSYQARGRRLIRGAKGSTTAVPIYPSRGHLKRALERVGMTVVAHKTQALPSGETVLFAVR